MKTAARNLFAVGLGAVGLGAAALCASVPATAASFSQPGGTMGAPAGAVPPPGLYFANSANWGVSGSSPSVASGIEIPAFIWSSGWNILGASYAASVAGVFVDVGTHDQNYLLGAFNPYINPVTLSWNLGHGIFVSFGEGIYIPLKSDVVFASGAPNTTTSGAAFEQRLSVSYIANDWILSANSIFGLTTNDSAGVKSPDYINLDATIAHTFGKWELGVVGYGAWDIENTGLTFANGGRGEAIGIGGLVGYNFGPVNLTMQASHQIVTHGFTNYGKDDTRVWTTLVIPIWNPAPAAAPHPLVAKY